MPLQTSLACQSQSESFGCIQCGNGGLLSVLSIVPCWSSPPQVWYCANVALVIPYRFVLLFSEGRICFVFIPAMSSDVCPYDSLTSFPLCELSSISHSSKICVLFRFGWRMWLFSIVSFIRLSFLAQTLALGVSLSVPLCVSFHCVSPWSGSIICSCDSRSFP